MTDPVTDPETQEQQEPQRLYFHVGLPKSGSTYIQSVLGNNRAALRAQGYVYPYVRQEGMFHAAVEMAGEPRRWGLDAERVSGTFAHLLRRGRRLGGTVVLSHEIFGSATRAQIATMGELLQDFDVHLVVTARDLGRTMTAEWQERVKNGHDQSFEEFSSGMLEGLPGSDDDPGVFWRSQNLAALLDRWGTLVPPERTHVVVCPPSGAAPDVLWSRFAEAIDLPADSVDLSEVPVRNESLGIAQIAFLRQVLQALGDRLEQPWYSRIAKRWFAQTLLSTARSEKPVTPAPLAARLAEVSTAWTERIRAEGYVVHGDLGELLPEATARETRHPDDVTEEQMVAGLAPVVAEMLLRTRDLRLEIEALQAQKQELEAAHDRLQARVEELTAAPDRPRRWWRRGS